MLSIYNCLKICLHQDEDVRYPPSRPTQGGYGAYNAYISAATRYAALGAPTLYDHPGSAYGSKSSICYRFFVRSEHTETFLSLVFHCLTSINQEDTMDPLKQWARRYLLVDFHKKQTQMT